MNYNLERGKKKGSHCSLLNKRNKNIILENKKSKPIQKGNSQKWSGEHWGTNTQNKRDTKQDTGKHNLEPKKPREQEIKISLWSTNEQ